MHFSLDLLEALVYTSPMDTVDYKKILKVASKEYEQLLKKREVLDLEIAKKDQFIRATTNMLPEKDRKNYEMFLLPRFVHEMGLTSSIRKVLQDKREWLTATAVRDALTQAGFDFSKYKTNPLASVHAILRRLKERDVESTYIDGVMAWKWKVSSAAKSILQSNWEEGYK